MIEVHADLWDYPADYRCITTNGIVMKNGELVMGAGIALQAKLRYPKLPSVLGKLVKVHGNRPFRIKDCKIISFPTKSHWKFDSELTLIENSAKFIAEMVKTGLADSIITSRPGCGLGGLKWEDVKPILEKYFTDERFIICHNQ